jgi:hypothetical protein
MKDVRWEELLISIAIGSFLYVVALICTSL